MLADLGSTAVLKFSELFGGDEDEPQPAPKRPPRPFSQRTIPLPGPALKSQLNWPDI